jgi:hypothetical protein
MARYSFAPSLLAFHNKPSMTGNVNNAGIAQLEITCPPAVAAAATKSVAVKSELDILARSTAGNLIVDQLFPDWRGDRSIGA